MRGRIRTVKPELLMDEQLWDLGVDSGLPVLQAFVGLWCYCDREGRFEWRPRALKALILPYWSGDFEAVLDALARQMFIVRYTVAGRHYGYVRTFRDHQAVNQREPASVLPSPEADGVVMPLLVPVDARTCTHVHDQSPHVGNGNGNGNGSGSGNGSGIGNATHAHDTPAPVRPVRTVTMPSDDPPSDYLDGAVMAGVSREQATATWTHYVGAGLPDRGVERLHP
jgi:hypothetical protein